MAIPTKLLIFAADISSLKKLAEHKHLIIIRCEHIEPYWHYLGADGGFSWGKSWDEFGEAREVKCESWEELLDIALEVSLEEAFGSNQG